MKTDCFVAEMFDFVINLCLNKEDELLRRFISK
jgi:hypothetical protein